MNNRFKKIKKLQTKFLLMVLPSVVVCFLIYSLFFAIFNYKEQKQNIITVMQNHADVQSAILAKSLWDVNFEVTQAHAESILLNPGISGVLVSELTTGTIIKVGSQPEKYPDKNYFGVQTDIVFKTPSGKKHLGMLRLVSKRDLTINPLLQSILRDTLLMFLLVLAIITSAMVANRTIMNIPLYRLLESIRRADEEKIRKPVDWHAGDELGRVITAYNDLLETLNIAEEKLKNSEEQYRTVFENTGSATVIIESDTSLSLVNSTFENFSGFSKEELEGGKKWTEFVIAEDLKQMIEYHTERRNSDQAVTEEYEFRFVARNGTIKHVVTKIRTIPRTNKSIASLMDITFLKKAEEKLRQSEERFRSLVEVSSDWIWEMDQYGTYIYASPKIKDLLGYEPESVIGKKIFDLMPPEQATQTKQTFEQILCSLKPFRNLELTVHHQDKRSIIIETSGAPIFNSDGRLSGYRGIDRDVTERKRIQEMIVQSEKMLSIGGLAAGMAHEINNPLAGIMQNAQVIQNRISKLTEKNEKVAREMGTTMETIKAYHEKRGVFKMIQAVIQSGQRAAKIVDNMLSFSRKEASQRVPVRLSELLDKTFELAENDYDIKKKQDFRQIGIVREYDETEPVVLCESSKIQQVFLNILKNGTEAMTEASVKNPLFIIRIKPDGDVVSVEIEDNGPGMDEATRKRVFEPFFTTKDVGIGTGLGLSVSYFIVTEDHGGTMSVETAPDQGTKFIIRLPQSRGGKK